MKRWGKLADFCVGRLTFVLGLAVFLGFSLLGTVTFADNQDKLLTLENEFIKLIVNKGPVDLGRFAVESTGGNPEISADDEQPLIYGRPLPWTSYTSINIDGTVYVFGGESRRLFKRASVPVRYGTVVSQVIEDKAIVTTCRFEDGVVVRQRLGFLRNPATGVEDTAKIVYTIENAGASSKKVGLRMMLDTKLGSNDGAPFRLGTRAVTEEYRFLGESIGEYWQAFDDLANPKVIAQGTFSNPELGLTPPNEVVLANWGSLSKVPWDFVYEEGRAFIREGEIEKDTALAMTFKPMVLAPGAKREIATAYGLGGVSLSAGQLSLGLSAPKERHALENSSFLMMAYLLNSGGFDSKDTVVSFDLPKGFESLSPTTTVRLGNVAPGETAQIPLRVRFKQPRPGKQTIRLTAKSGTLASNELAREIRVLSPPRLKTVLSLPIEKVVSQDVFLDAQLTVTNPSRYAIRDISASLEVADGLSIAGFDQAKKQVDVLGARETRALDWKLMMDGDKLGTVPVSVVLRSPVSSAARVSRSVLLKAAERQVLYVPSVRQVESGDVFYGELFLVAPEGDMTGRYTLPYDADRFRLLRVRESAVFLKDGFTLRVEKDTGIVTVVLDKMGEFDQAMMPVVKVHFLALQDGDVGGEVFFEGEKVY